MAKPLAPLSWTPSLPRSQWSTAPRFARRIVTPPGFRGSDGQIRSRRTGDLGPGGKSLQRWLDNQKRRGGTLDCTLELIVLADDGRTVGSDATGSIDPVGAGYVAPGRRRFADDCSSVRSDTPRPVHAVGTSGGIGRLGESRRPRKGHQRERSVFHWRFSRRFRNRDETDTGRGRPTTRFFGTLLIARPPDRCGALLAPINSTVAQRIVSAVSRVHIVPMQMRAQLGRGNEAM